MLVDIREKYLDGSRRLKIAQSLGPFDDHRSAGLVKNFFQPKSFQTPGFDAVEIDVVDRNSTFILIDQRKGRARHFVRILDAKRFSESLRKQRFTGPKVAIKKDVCRQRERAGKVSGKFQGLLL